MVVKIVVLVMVGRVCNWVVNSKMTIIMAGGAVSRTSLKEKVLGWLTWQWLIPREFALLSSRRWKMTARLTG